jgi:hypothetical protein
MFQISAICGFDRTEAGCLLVEVKDGYLLAAFLYDQMPW